MAIKLSSSKKATKHVKCVIYGESGIGKTPLGATAPKPVYIDADGGLLSVSDLDIPSIEVGNFDDVEEAVEILKTKKMQKRFDTVIVDDLTEVIQKLLQDIEDDESDKWEVYGKLGKKGKKIIRKLKRLNMNVVFLCKLHEKDDDGVVLRRPLLSGRVLPEALPYMVDEVFALRVMEGDEEEFKYLLTQPTNKWYAKDRSCKLKKIEKPDLTYIFKKIRSTKKGNK